MSSVYPGALDVIDDPAAGLRNAPPTERNVVLKLNAMMRAVQATLGQDPQGTAPDIATRLAALGPGGGNSQRTTLSQPAGFGQANQAQITVASPLDIVNSTGILIGATLASAEFARVTAGAGTLTMTLSRNLNNAHVAGEKVWVCDGDWVPVQWAGVQPGVDNPAVNQQNAFQNLVLQTLYGAKIVASKIDFIYLRRPVWIPDSSVLKFVRFWESVTLDIDPTIGKRSSNGVNTAGGQENAQYLVTLGGRSGAISSVDVALNRLTLTGDFSANVTPGERIMFHARPGSTLPGGIEEGRSYFVRTNPTPGVVTISLDQFAATDLDITSAVGGTGSGVDYGSPGMSRPDWENFEVRGRESQLNGLLTLCQQPGRMYGIRARSFGGPRGCWELEAQEGSFFQVEIGTTTSVGLRLCGAQFVFFYDTNLELCATAGCILENGGSVIQGLGSGPKNVGFYGGHAEQNGGTTAGSTGPTFLAKHGQAVVVDNWIHSVSGGTNQTFWHATGPGIGVQFRTIMSLNTPGFAVVDDVRGISYDWTYLDQNLDFLNLPGHPNNRSHIGWRLGTHETSPSQQAFFGFDDWLNEVVLSGVKLRFAPAGSQTGPTITRGVGVPAAAEPSASLYLREDTGGLYSRVSGAWSQIVGTGGGQNLINNTVHSFDANRNMSIGSAMASLSTGVDNYAYGNSALISITTASNSIGIGTDALKLATTGGGNIMIGSRTGDAITTGGSHIGIGTGALSAMVAGQGHIAIGELAGALLTSAQWPNVMIGHNAMYNTTGGGAGGMVAIGWLAGANMSTAAGLTVAIGLESMYWANPTATNVAVGSETLKFDIGAGRNTAVGCSALNGTGVYGWPVVDPNTQSIGSRNTGVGYNAGAAYQNGSDNVFVGCWTGTSQGGVGANSVQANRQVLVGVSASQVTATDRNDVVAVGYRAQVDADNTVALGSGARALHAGSVALGQGAVTTKTNQVMVGARSIEITDTTQGLILKSPDGTRYLVKVANGGALSTVVAP